MNRTTTAVPEYKKNIFEAALHNDHEAVRLFVEGVPVASRNHENQTAAHIAAKNGNIVILKYLLGKDPTLVHVKDTWDKTILHYAVEKGSVELVKFLVDECNADIYEPCEQRHNNTAIHMAAHGGNLEVLKYFIEDKGADIDVKNAYGEPPSFSAAENGQVNIIKYLLTQNANITMVDVNGDNILYVSATTGDVSVPRFLLKFAKLNFDLNTLDNFGDAILHRAVWNNRIDFLKYIVPAHRPNLNVIDMYDRTPLHVAAHLGNIYIVRFLVGHGTDTELEDCWHRRALESSSNYEVITYLDSVQGYKFTLHEGYRESTIRPNISYRATKRTTQTLLYNIELTTQYGGRTRKGRRRPIIRVERSAPTADFTSRTRQPGLLSKGIQGVSLNSKDRVDSISGADVYPSGLNNFLVFADVGTRYFLKMRNQYPKHQSLLSPHEILQNRMSTIAVDAVNTF